MLLVTGLIIRVHVLVEGRFGSLKDIILSRNDPKCIGSPGLYLAIREGSNSCRVFNKCLHESKHIFHSCITRDNYSHVIHTLGLCVPGACL